MTKEIAVNPDTIADSALITRRQLAQFSGFALQTLKKWPAEGKGPRVTRVEGRPRYRMSDVRAWMGVNDV